MGGQLRPRLGPALSPRVLLASHLLSLAARRLARDWHEKWRRCPALLETS